MPTFIDESGDTGPAGEGGKPFFRLAAVWVPSHEDAAKFREGVRQLRRRMGLKETYEFKFSKTADHPERRSAFFALALAQEFRFAVDSIDKTDAYWSRAGSREIHWACATELAASLRPVYAQALRESGGRSKEPVVVDDNSDHIFLQIIKEQFRPLRAAGRPDLPLVGKVSFRDSAADEMLQIVDMICGAVGHRIDDADPTWYELIQGRDLEPGRWPRNQAGPGGR